MCGIIGLSLFNAEELKNAIYEGIKKLQKEGCGTDSCGVAYLTRMDRLVRMVALGDIDNLKPLLDVRKIKTNETILHTRLASVGDITVYNAHPFLNEKKNVALCGNGHTTTIPLLKEHDLVGETDTERILHCIEENIELNDNYEEIAGKLHELDEKITFSHNILLLNNKYMIVGKFGYNTLYLKQMESGIVISTKKLVDGDGWRLLERGTVIFLKNGNVLYEKTFDSTRIQYYNYFGRGWKANYMTKDKDDEELIGCEKCLYYTNEDWYGRFYCVKNRAIYSTPTKCTNFTETKLQKTCKYCYFHYKEYCTVHKRKLKDQRTCTYFKPNRSANNYILCDNCKVFENACCRWHQKKLNTNLICKSFEWITNPKGHKKQFYTSFKALRKEWDKNQREAEKKKESKETSPDSSSKPVQKPLTNYLLDNSNDYFRDEYGYMLGQCDDIDKRMERLQALLDIETDTANEDLETLDDHKKFNPYEFIKHECYRCDNIQEKCADLIFMIENFDYNTQEFEELVKFQSCVCELFNASVFYEF